jgi:uncharacterized protein (UPF0179 family)
MPLVTLVGEKIAKEGKTFTYLGPNNDCRNCKLKTVCFNLKPGRGYKIIKIRDKRHSCSVHEGNAAVVEVQEQTIVATINKEHSKGESIKTEKKECGNIGCDHYELCNHLALKKDKEYKVVKTYDDKIDCPLGYKLQKAELND